MARLYWHFDPPSLQKLKKPTKNVVKVGPPLTKLSGSAHVIKLVNVFKMNTL